MTRRGSTLRRIQAAILCLSLLIRCSSPLVAGDDVANKPLAGSFAELLSAADPILAELDIDARARTLDTWAAVAGSPEKQGAIVNALTAWNSDRALGGYGWAVGLNAAAGAVLGLVPAIGSGSLLLGGGMVLAGAALVAVATYALCKKLLRARADSRLQEKLDAVSGATGGSAVPDAEGQLLGVTPGGHPARRD